MGEGIQNGRGGSEVLVLAILKGGGCAQKV